MLTLWQAIAILVALAAGFAFARLLRAEYRLYRARQLRERLDFGESPLRTSEVLGTDYSGFDQDAQLRNRSERSQDW